jgi:hypothetical protein
MSSVHVGDVRLIVVRRQGILFPLEPSCRSGLERSVVLRRYVCGRMIGVYLGKCLVDRATILPSTERWAHQESDCVARECVRRYNNSLQRPGGAQHVAQTRHAGGSLICARVAHQPPAELGR